MMSERPHQAVTIRYPATANLMIDSEDRSAGTASDFQITRPNSILNGFFTRIGTTEVVLEWNEPNGALLADGPTFQCIYESTLSTFVSTTVNYNLPEAWYTVEGAFSELTDTLNSAFGLSTSNGNAFFAGNFLGAPAIQTENSASFYFTPNATTSNLGIVAPSTNQPVHLINNPDLRLVKFIDFTSAQLTYNQDLKDASTAPIVRDVLCRWYMDWDTPPQLDALGFPIDMGYAPFRVRRLFNPPKQIRWDNRMPVGNIAFQLYGSDQNLLSLIPGNETQWRMTLQVSED